MDELMLEIDTLNVMNITQPQIELHLQEKQNIFHYVFQLTLASNFELVH